MEVIEIVDNKTGKILFTLKIGDYDSTYTLMDNLGMSRNVSVYHMCDNDPCARAVWPRTVESFAYKKP